MEATEEVEVAVEQVEAEQEAAAVEEVEVGVVAEAEERPGDRPRPLAIPVVRPG